MAFRKRNVGLSRHATDPGSSSPSTPTPAQVSLPGVRPSPVDGRPVTSTGIPSFDSILAGHGGLALGNSILLEENGTTDFAGIMLRYYAAEGVVQGHKLHVVGAGELWARDLPGVIGSTSGLQDEKGREKEKERMKIAWRYERLGEFGAASRDTLQSRMILVLNFSRLIWREGSPQADRAAPTTQEPQSSPSNVPAAFSHTFDLTKKLILPTSTAINFIPLAAPNTSDSPFASVLENISRHLSANPPSTVHRLAIPTILSPMIYPPHASQPHHLLQFLHGLRGLLRTHAGQLTAMITLPLGLYPRLTGLIRWMELLCDGVIELTPFPHLMDAPSALASSGAATAQEDPPQGMLKIHRLPVFHERGGGGGGQSGLGDDLAFTASRRKFVIKPFSLPPVEGDTEAQQGNIEGGGKQTKVDMSF